VAYKHGTGLGTAPWYGVPGTAYDFGNSKSAGATYNTDASHPTGYGYESPVAQYHSQPSYGGYKSGADRGYGGGKATGKSGQCGSDVERYVIQHANNDVTYPAAHVDKAAIPAGYRPNNVVGGAVHGMAVQNSGYEVAPTAYSSNADGSKVGHDGPAGYVSGRYESIGYGYMY